MHSFYVSPPPPRTLVLYREKKNYLTPFFYTVLLGLASQRAENTLLELLAMEIEWLHDVLAEWKRKERGSWPGVVESALYLYIISKYLIVYNRQTLESCTNLLHV